MNPLIFLSYSSKDKLVADAICSRLENQGIRCWIAPRDVKPGSDYSNQIADALESSTTMVMVFSSDSNTSRHVKSEIDRAFSLGKIIIPFRVENVELDKGLAYYLAKTHWLDAVTKPLEQHIDRLATTIRQVSGTQAPEDLQKVVVTPTPQVPPRQKKAVWLAAGVLALCALVAGIGLLFFWLNQRKSATVQTAPPVPESSPGPATSTLSRSLSPSASFSTNQADSPAVSPSDQNQFEGTWTIAEAETLDGIPYAGTVQITKRGGRYEVTWRSSASTASGIGLAAGNKLCVAWSPNDFGVVFYKIGQDGTLKGRWTGSATPRETSEGLENASGGAPGKIEGEYVVKGTNPGGREYYQGKLEITRTGETYQLQWNVAGRLTNGVGIKVDDGFFVAWGNKEPFGVISYSLDGAQAKGVWTLVGATKTASESLAK